MSAANLASSNLLITLSIHQTILLLLERAEYEYDVQLDSDSIYKC